MPITTPQSYDEDQISKYTVYRITVVARILVNTTCNSKFTSKIVIFISLIKDHRYCSYCKDLMLNILNRSPLVLEKYIKCVT